MKFSKVSALFVLFALFAVMVPGYAEAAVEVKMSYNGPGDVENNAVHLYAVNFKKFVEEGTGGEVTIALFPDSQLGNEEERMELLSKQGMNQPIVNVASFAGVAPVFPEIYATAVPFMFDSFKAAHIFTTRAVSGRRRRKSSTNVPARTSWRLWRRAVSLRLRTTREKSGRRRTLRD